MTTVHYLANCEYRLTLLEDQVIEKLTDEEYQQVPRRLLQFVCLFYKSIGQYLGTITLLLPTANR